MKYYGYIYKGAFDVYHCEGAHGFDSPYKALNFANKQWQDNSDLQIARLLVVKKDDNVENSYAFFQFTDYNACKKFIDNNETIIWSCIDEQKWNGNAKMM